MLGGAGLRWQVLARRMEDDFRFDTSRLVGPGERAEWEAPAQQVAPLLSELGRLVVTGERVYFQVHAEGAPPGARGGRQLA